MKQLITTLPTILEAAGDSPEVTQAAVIAAWNHIAGEGLRSHAAAIGFNEKKLVIVVADRVWQQQLESMRRQLAFRLNALLGKPLVRSIELRIAPNALSSANRAMNTKTSNEPIENEISLELWAAANAIQDKQLRKAFLGAATANIKRLNKQKE